MTKEFCQSCGMPLQDGVYATEKDGTLNKDYCMYCYKDGAFLQDVTMEGMVDFCLQFLDQMNAASGMNLTHDEAKAQMMSIFPTLKRWKNKESV